MINNTLGVTIKSKPVVYVRVKPNSQVKKGDINSQIEPINETELLNIIDERIKSLNVEQKTDPIKPEEQNKSEIGIIPWDLINFSGGYPFSPNEIPFKSAFKDDHVMVRLAPTFSAITNTPYLFNVYDVTPTGFKLRMNVKNIENKGLLKALYYEAIQINN